MKTERLTVGMAIVKYLANQYSERDGKEERLISGVFGIFGHGNVAGLGQGLIEVGREVDLPYFRPQNEQAMVHIAIAYAKHKNRMSTFACTSSIGPGATNMVTGAATATINRLPVLLLPSDYFANRIPDPVLQQLEHPLEHDVSVNDAFRPVSRYFDRIYRPEQLLSSLPEAMRVLTDPAETGAVTIALPEDVQAEAYGWPAEFFEKRVWHIRRPEPEQVALRRAIELIGRAQRPLIIVGGGVIYAEATEELRAFTESFGIPMAETQAGKGALPWDHPMNVGPVGANGGLAANRLARTTDLVIAVGTRLGDFATASKTAFQNPEVRYVGINVVPMDAAKLGTLSIVADAKRALSAVTEALREAEWPGTDVSYREDIARLKEEWDREVEKLRSIKDPDNLSQGEVIGIINEFAGGKATVICAAGSMPGDLLKLWRPADPKAYHLEYGYSCMGYEIPAGIGVKLAEPERDVYVMIGDGSYLMMNSEIVTAVTEGLKFTVVLVDNHGFQSIRGLQLSAGSPSFGNELRFRDPGTRLLEGAYVPVEFKKHAEAMGAQAFFARTETELRRAVEEASRAHRVSVVVVQVDPERRVPSFEGWWDVPVSGVSKETSVQEARRTYEENKKDQRTYFKPTQAAEDSPVNWGPKST